MTDIILTEIKNGIGFITLNSPKNLNSLGLEMANALLTILEEWRTNDDVHCLFLQGNDKSFCAGGDLVSLYQKIRNNSPGVISKEALEFFIKEYTLDYTIHKYKKPIITWGSGIVMGGGLGLLVGTSHRIMTEKSILAMPEITIGLYPDVAATWFLNQMPDGWGYYFGLTGARMTGGDAIYLGIADYYIPSNLKEFVIDKLMSQNWNKLPEENKITIDELLKKIAVNNMISPVKERKDFAKKLSTLSSVLEFRSLIEELARHDEWIRLGLLSFKAGSPTSAMVIYQQLNRGKFLDLEQVFYSELNLTVQFSIRADFPEGIRALLIDKDRRPKWGPQTLEEVKQVNIESYFVPILDSSDPLLDSFICSPKYKKIN